MTDRLAGARFATADEVFEWHARRSPVEKAAKEEIVRETRRTERERLRGPDPLPHVIPPEPYGNGLYWLEHRDGEKRVFEYLEGEWLWMGSEVPDTPKSLGRAGWSYYGTCRPPIKRKDQAIGSGLRNRIDWDAEFTTALDNGESCSELARRLGVPQAVAWEAARTRGANLPRGKRGRPAGSLRPPRNWKDILRVAQGDNETPGEVSKRLGVPVSHVMRAERQHGIRLRRAPKGYRTPPLA